MPRPPDTRAAWRRGVAQPPDADLRVHRIQLGTAAVSAHQPAAGVAALGSSVELAAIGLFAADPAAVHLEISLVAAGRPLRAAAARPPSRLDASHAAPAPRLDPCVRAAAAAARSVDDRVSRDSGGVLRRHAGHRARRLSPRAAARSGTGAGQRDPRAGLSDLESRAGRAGVDPRRSLALGRGVRDHRAVHAARHREHPADLEPALARPGAADALPKRWSNPSTSSSRAPAGDRRCSSLRVHLLLQARRLDGHRARHPVLPRHRLFAVRDRTHRQERRPGGER